MHKLEKFKKFAARVLMDKIEMLFKKANEFFIIHLIALVSFRFDKVYILRRYKRGPFYYFREFKLVYKISDFLFSDIINF